jgi:hypothetical protein
MTINRGCEASPVESGPHKDKTDAFYGWACVFTFGVFTGGDVILWELESMMEMNSGDALFIPAHLITHSNRPVTSGIRHSLVAYARQETLNKDQNPNASHDKSRKEALIKNRGLSKRQKILD